MNTPVCTLMKEFSSFNSHPGQLLVVLIFHMWIEKFSLNVTLHKLNLSLCSQKINDPLDNESNECETYSNSKHRKTSKQMSHIQRLNYLTSLALLQILLEFRVLIVSFPLQNEAWLGNPPDECIKVGQEMMIAFEQHHNREADCNVNETCYSNSTATQNRTQKTHKYYSLFQSKTCRPRWARF